MILSAGLESRLRHASAAAGWTLMASRAARRAKKSVVTTTSVSLSKANTGASLRLVILDACRNNPLARSSPLPGADRDRFMVAGRRWQRDA